MVFFPNAYFQPLSRLCFCKIVNIFATRITNTGKDTSLNRDLKRDITAYFKFLLISYKTCDMNIFVGHPLNEFPHLIHHPLNMLYQLLNTFHFFATSIKHNGEDTSLNRYLKGNINSYPKL